MAYENVNMALNDDVREVFNREIGKISADSSTQQANINDINGRGQVKKHFNAYNGTNIVSSVFGNIPHAGMLYVVDTESPKYLIASFFKFGTAGSPVVTVLSAVGLTLGDNNNEGTQVINGGSANENIRMMAIHHNIV